MTDPFKSYPARNDCEEALRNFLASQDPNDAPLDQIVAGLEGIATHVRNHPTFRDFPASA
jgi:hypothetical protein